MPFISLIGCSTEQKEKNPPAAGTTGGSFHNSIIIIFSQNGINGRLIQAQ